MDNRRYDGIISMRLIWEQYISRETEVPIRKVSGRIIVQEKNLGFGLCCYEAGVNDTQ